jgi:hypothetical protein
VNYRLLIGTADAQAEYGSEFDHGRRLLKDMAEFVYESEENFLDGTPTIAWSESDSRAICSTGTVRGYMDARLLYIASRRSENCS